MIDTPRLHLTRFHIEHAVALQRGRSELAAILGVAIPEGWPHFPEAYAVDHVVTTGGGPDAASDTWGTYLFVLRDRTWLVGSGGYKGRPTDGVVEVGYEVAPKFRGRGLATEATRGMVGHAFSHPAVEFVQAHTLGVRNPSTRVLEKLGMELVEEIVDDEEGTVWWWGVSRSEWRPSA